MQPKAPNSFRKLLRRFDRFLDLEWLGNHWAVVDTTKLVSVHEIDGGGITTYKKVYDRLCHLRENEWLGTNVLNRLRSMSMERWKKPSDLIKRLEGQEKEAEASKMDEAFCFQEAAIMEKERFVDREPLSFHVNRGDR